MPRLSFFVFFFFGGGVLYASDQFFFSIRTTPVRQTADRLFPQLPKQEVKSNLNHWEAKPAHPKALDVLNVDYE